LVCCVTTEVMSNVKPFSCRESLSRRANDVVCDDAYFDGGCPIVTNDTQMTGADLLSVYKRQPGVENRHHALKGVVSFVPVCLKSNERIDAFAYVRHHAS
jgi:transposase